MQGPLTEDPMIAKYASTDWEMRHLKRGQEYRVIKTFIDADNYQHTNGEKWSFQYSMFNKFDDELTLFVRKTDESLWSIALIWKEDYQQAVIENLTKYIQPN